MKLLVGKIEGLNMGLKKVNKVAIVKLINNLNYRGKKISREKDVFLLVKTIKGRRKVSGLDFLEKTMKRIAPLVFLKRKKVGGATYRIPVYLYPSKSYNFAVKWLISTSCGRKAGSLRHNMVKECRAIFNNRGKTLNKKEKLYQQALANRAFIKYL